MTAPTRSEIDPQRQISLQVVRWQGNVASSATDELVAEEPLEIRASERDAAGHELIESVAVIMRTPGNDEELACGFLFTEGIVTGREEISALREGMDEDGMPSANILEISPAKGVRLIERLRNQGYTRNFAVNSSCGICGKNSVAAACALLSRLPLGGFTVAPDVLYQLPEKLRAEQRVFAHTGGLHAAAIFDRDGRMLGLREDVGRHNAVDKLVGRALLDGMLPLQRRVLLVSGRLSYEIVLKAFAAGIPIIAAVSAPSSLALDLAEAAGITVIGFLRGTNMNVYTHAARILAQG